MRAVMSGWPPGVKPITNRTGRVGNAVAPSAAYAGKLASVVSHKAVIAGVAARIIAIPCIVSRSITPACAAAAETSAQPDLDCREQPVTRSEPQYSSE